MMEVIKLILGRLDTLFRYVLPGFVVIGAAYAAHPKWFGWCRSSEMSSLLFLCGLALLVGALAYTIHRFSLHQGLDYLCWKVLNKWGKGYRDSLKAAIEKGVPKDRINEHIAVRSSQLILLFISAEATAFFAILPPDQGSPIQDYRCLMVGGAFLALVFGVWQYSLINELDRTLDRQEAKTGRSND